MTATCFTGSRLGMPYPKNLQTAMEVEAIVRDNGAIPATIAILDGVPHVGQFSATYLFTFFIHSLNLETFPSASTQNVILASYFSNHDTSSINHTRALPRELLMI